MRSAPSSRIVSPLSIGFSTMWTRERRELAGSPSRCGKGIALPSSSRASCGSAPSSGVSNVPGRDRARRECRGWRGRAPPAASCRRCRPSRRSRRSARSGRRRPRSRRCSRRRRARRSPRLVLVHRGGGEAQHVEGADQVDRGARSRTAASWWGPRLETVRSAQPTPAQHTLIRRPLGLAACATAAATWASSVTSQRNERRPLAELAGQRLALLRVQVGDGHCAPRGVQRAGGRLAQPGRASGNECSDSLDSHGARTLHA